MAQPVSTNPNVIGKFSVLNQIRSSRYKYIGTADLSLTWMPSYVRMPLNRIKAITPSLSRASIICACVSHGVDVISSHERITELIRLTRDINTMREGVDVELLEEVDSMIEHCSLTIPSVSTSRGTNTRKNYRINENVNDRLTALAMNLGAYKTAIAVLAMMITLSTQPTTLNTHKEHIEDTVRRFFNRLPLRCKVFAALLELLEESVSEVGTTDREYWAR